MLSLESISNLRALLNRVQLTGAEVPPFNKIMSELAMEEMGLTRPVPQQAALQAVPTAADDQAA